MYKIAFDPIHALVRIQMNAMLGVSDTERLVGELITTITEAKLDNYALIIDVSQCPVQSQDMIASMEQLLKLMKRVRALAIVTGTTLVRLQVQRIFLQPMPASRPSSTKRSNGCCSEPSRPNPNPRSASSTDSRRDPPRRGSSSLLSAVPPAPEQAALVQ
ncbi:hypothetical protein U1701_15960 [Sphingomonas sp. PB2P19]|uniref:hypothetical protein n=1 Tax=Sphingomonas rhamnosi TaxID=3096156 RepID=UPI002FCA3066